MNLESAKASVKKYRDLLSETAKAYARGEVSFEDLAEAAKKHTNAAHALGRAEKASK